MSATWGLSTPWRATYFWKPRVNSAFSSLPEPSTSNSWKRSSSNLRLPSADLGGKRVIQVRFNVSVPRARVPNKSIHASRPFREMIARPKISRNEWKTAEIGAFEVGNFALFCCPAPNVRTGMRASSQGAFVPVDCATGQFYRRPSSSAARAPRSVPPASSASSRRSPRSTRRRADAPAPWPRTSTRTTSRRS